VAIADLIERQIAYADFSVDPTGVDLLRFKRIVFIAFTDGEPILNHPRTNWSHEREHLFSGTLSRIANALVIADEGVNTKERPMHFHEFEAFVQSPENLDRFSPLTEILDTFSIARKPVFWLRLVCFAFICNEYVATAGGSIGFARRPFDLPKLLLTAQDEHIRAHADQYAGIFRSMLNVDL
jgi:hypothetical protein